MGDNDGDYGFAGAIWDRVRGFFAAMWEGVWSSFYKIFPPLLNDIADDFKKVWHDSDDQWWDKFLETTLLSGFMNDEQVAYFRQFKDMPSLPSFAMLAIVAGSTMTLQMKAILGASAITAEQKTNESQRPHIPDVNSLIKSAFIAPERTHEIREFLGKHGFSDHAIDYLFLSNYTLYDVFTCRDLFLRGVLNNDQIFERMRELGFTDTRTKEIMQTWEVIPGAGDLFHLVAKEAFEPDSIKEMGLDAEFPEEQVEWLTKQGLSKDWALKYWYAHWEMPSLQMGFEMLHRGVIDGNQLNTLFKTVEIPPYWRDKLTRIAYLPYSRVDVRRMFDFDVLKIEDVYRSYRDLGYDHEHALKMTEWTAAQKDPVNKDISMGQILSTFEDNVLERTDAKALLQDIGYSENKAEFLLSAREFETAQKMEKKQIDIIGTKFVNRYIDKFEALRLLSLLNLPFKQQNLLMEEWELDLMQDNKLPSKTDLEKFFLQDIISTDQYDYEMNKLGYNKEYTSWFRKVLEIKKGVKANVTT